jgi:hypothetical protein
MAEDDIVQKVVIEVDDTALAKVGDTAQTSFNKLEQAAGSAGSSLQGVQAAAGQVGTGAAKLGAGLDQVAEKTVVTTRQMRAMGTVMRVVGESGAASVATGFVKIGAALGPIGIALYAAAEAFSFIKGKMKEWEDQAKATIEVMGNIAKIAKENAPTGPMPFTGGAAYDLPKAIDSAKAFVAALKDAGIAVDDVAADTKKIGDASYQASLQAAKLYEKMSPIEKLDFEKVLKGLGFTPEQIASIEKGTAALKQARLEAEASSWENWAPAFRKLGDAITSAAQAAGAFFSDFGQRLVDAVNVSMAQVKDAIVGAFNAVLGPVKSVIDTIGGWIQGLVNAAKALWAGLTGGGGSVAPGGAPGMAAGGEVGGAPGVDRNLALLSRGEFVLNVAAVQRVGLPFLHAINAMQIVPRFALGGLNTGMRPSIVGAAAVGGSSSRALHLTIEGRSFGPMTMQEGVAGALERFAVHSQIASVGRKQSWRK